MAVVVAVVVVEKQVLGTDSSLIAMDSWLELVVAVVVPDQQHPL